MRSRRRVVLLALGILLAAGSAVAAFWAWREARRAREPFWLDDLEARSWVAGLAFSPSEEWLVGGHTNGDVSVWSLAERRLVRHESSADTELESLGAVAFTAKGFLAAETGGRGTLGFRRLPTWEVVGSLEDDAHVYRGRTLAAHGDCVARTAYVSNEFEIHVWDAAGLPRLVTKVVSPAEVLALAFSRDGTRLVALDARSDKLSLLDALTGKRLASIPGLGGAAVAVSPASDTIATGSGDALRVDLLSFDGLKRGTIDLPAPRDLDARLVHLRVDSLAFSPDGRTLAAAVHCFASGPMPVGGGPDRSWLALWDLERGKPLPLVDSTAAGPDSWTFMARAVTFSPSGRLVAVAFGSRVSVFAAPD